MEHLLNFLILPTAYRVAGSDFPLPHRKAIRRFGIPLYLCVIGLLRDLNPLTLILPLLVMMAVLTFNLDEIEEKDWDDVFCYGFALSFCLYPLGGIYSGIVGLWWFTGVILSNVGVGFGGIKLDWKYVEIGVGVAMAGAMWLNHF